MTVGDLTERELIARIQCQLPPPPPWMPVGIGDDAAVVEPERNRLEVLSVDALVEGVHFDRAFTPPSAIGHRALAVNLSDLAAMGATPRLALVSLALPAALPCAEFDDMISGLARLAAEHRMHVAGGNLTRSPGPLMLDITVVGTVKRRQTMTRSGARPGDELYVSGTIGAAAAGLMALRDGVASSDIHDCVNRFLYPVPRLRLGTLLGRTRAASACIDLSDGLADGVRQIAGASGVGAEVDAAAVPVDPCARMLFGSQGIQTTAIVDEAVTRGDDYELLFTVRPRSGRRLKAARHHGGVALTRIGVCTASPDLVLCDSASSNTCRRPLPAGYTHFR
jgi:thiamine-monophosphate kinase